MSVHIHGREYFTCAERLALVHESKKPFQVLESSPLQVGDRWLWRVVITVDNCQYIGTAEVKLANARPGSPDSSNPFECGETSALARALGIAGLGAPDSVCSADEITRSQPKESDAQATDQQLASIRKLCSELGRSVPDVASYADAKAWIAQLSQEYRERRKSV